MEDPCGKSAEEVFLSKVSSLEEEGDIFNRIRSYHGKARNILEDWARKPPLKIVRLAAKLQYAQLERISPDS
jgi:hypothetical protein